MQVEAMMIMCLAMIALLLVQDFAPQTVDGVPIPKPEKPKRKPWEEFLHFKKGGGSAPAPDPNIGVAALKNAELGEDWLKFAQDQFGQANKRQETLDALTKQVTNKQLGVMDKTLKWADEDRATGQAFRDRYSKFGQQQMDRYNQTFKPIEDKLATDAMNWDSKARMDEEAGKARSTVLANVAAQRESRAREQASMGVKPGSGRSVGTARADDINAALAGATAENSARDSIRQQAQAMRGNAASLGQTVSNSGMQATNLGLAASGLGSTSAGLGLNAGTSALSNNFANNASWGNNASIMGQGFQGAMSGYGNMGNLLNAQYGNQLSAWNAQQQASAQGASGLMSGLGTLGGAAMMAWSSKKLKEDKKPAKGALQAVRGMPVELWKYKDGVADGGRHIGAYAEDFQRETGLGNGKAIPLQDAIGITMKAVQELDQKVSKIAGKAA